MIATISSAWYLIAGIFTFIIAFWVVVFILAYVDNRRWVKRVRNEILRRGTQ